MVINPLLTALHLKVRRLKELNVCWNSVTLMELHWLPIRHRMTFKLATLTYKILRDNEPDYLSELLSFYQPERDLRSSSQGLLTVKRTRTVLATRGFKHSSVSIWNSLPVDRYS